MLCDNTLQGIDYFIIEEVAIHDRKPVPGQNTFQYAVEIHDLNQNPGVLLQVNLADLLLQLWNHSRMKLHPD